MRTALVVNKVTRDRETTFAALLGLIEAGAQAGAQLVLCPEASLTGLTNIDQPAHDLPLGEPILGAVTARLGGLHASAACGPIGHV